jgi:hypothetical protein
VNPPPFVLAILGSSLSTGRLSADWVPTLTYELPDQPQAVGRIIVYNLGKGSQNSAWGVTQIPLLTALKPTHILFEGFAINDCIDTGSGPAISQAAHIANIQTMAAAFIAGIPGVDLTIQTMSSISASIAGTRPQLAAYYADEITTGNALGIRTLDNYSNWPTPLNQALTQIDPNTGVGDGLHPIWTGAVDTYLYPNVLSWARTRMAEHFGLAIDGQLDFSNPDQSAFLAAI